MPFTKLDYCQYLLKLIAKAQQALEIELAKTTIAEFAHNIQTLAQMQDR